MEKDFLDSVPLERRLAGLTPEQVLAGLTPEQVLAGLTPEELLPALPVEILRGFTEEYLRSFPPDVVEKIMKRLGR